MSEGQILKLKQPIDNIALLSSEAWDDLQCIVFVSEIEKDDFLVTEGGKASNEAFILKGVMRGFYRSFDGEEINVTFYTENSVLPPLHTRSKNNVTQLNIQALSDVVIGKFNAEQFTSLLTSMEA